MKKLTTIFAMAIAMMLAMSSCADPDATTQLTDGAWTFSDMTTDTDDETIKGFITLGKAVMSGATLEFQEGGDFMITPADEWIELGVEVESGSWSLIGDDQLILTPDGEGSIPSTANIDELTDSKLKYIETFVDENLTSYNVTTTWSR